MSRFIITGATGGAPNRLEINAFVKNEEHFSLFIQALQAMQQEDQNDLASFFSVGKVHGLPYRTWNDAVGSQPWNPSTAWGGYCTHGSVLFPTWHRPYMMLYEQIIQSHARRIAATYAVNQAAWRQAAEELRHPFWDWALNAVPPDEVIAMRQVVITVPNGNRLAVDNPLYHYRFHPVDPSFPQPFSRWDTTIRHPTTGDSSATDDVDRLKLVLRSSQDDITSGIYNMLSRVHNWNAFSNHTAGDGGSTSNSIEAIHDGIHVNIGGGGQMSDPGVAGFDPIFFLHHGNVDRLVQLWAALNPGVWVTPNSSIDGTFTIPASTPVDQNTPLTPFWNGQTSFWSSAGARDTIPLGYSYPDFNGVDMGNAESVKLAIGDRVNKLYGSSIVGGLRPIAPSPVPVPSAIPISLATSLPGIISPPFGGIPPVPITDVIPVVPVAENSGSVAPTGASHAPLAKNWKHRTEQAPSDTTAENEATLSAPVAAAQLPQPGPGHPIASKDLLVPPNQGLFDWTARIEFKKYELGQSFAVLLFFGQVPDDPHDWLVCPNYVGSHMAFVNTSASQCANCVSQVDVVIEGFVHLNKAIIKHAGFPSLDADLVEPYLKKNLHWRVYKVPGVVASLSSLEVSVYCTPLSYPPDAVFPVPGDRCRLSGITYGRDGGSRHV